MKCIELDRGLTRRKRYHSIYGHEGDFEFSSMFASDVFEQLAAEGEDVYYLITRDRVFLVTAVVQPDPKD